MEVYFPIFRWSCSNFELMQILVIIWIAVMVYWQYFIITVFSGSKVIFPSMKAVLRTLELELVLFLLTIWILDCLCLARIVKISLHSLSVSFWDGSSSLCFSMKLFKFWAYAKPLDHLDCRLAVFYSNFFIQEQNLKYC